MNKIKIGDDTVYLKKSFDGYRVIYPLKNEDGSYNWYNIILGGNIWNFLKILAVFLLLILAIVIYHYDTETCSNTLKHIDEICLALEQGKPNPYYNSTPLQLNVKNVTV